jgi:RHS repeat-associated protein
LWGSGGYSFAGMPFYDTNTNTNPTMFRFYSQNLGRWHSPDPLAGDITNPQSLNRYAYVLNNPTRLTDPLGLGGDDDCTWDPSTSTLTCPKPPPEETSQSNKPDNPSDPYGLAYLPLGRGWGLGGGCGPTPGQQKIRQVVNLALHQQELSDCLNKIFGPGNILNNQNLPILDTRVSQAQINSQSRRLGVQGTYQTPVPTSGRGTVQIPTELFYNPNTTMGFLAATFIHETGNILAIQMFGSSRYAQATNPAIVGLDRDTGAALEECVFGGLVRPNGSTWP